MLPSTVLQDFLDRVGRAVLTERFEDYLAHVQLPLRIVTSSARLNVTSLEDLQDGFDAFNDMIQSRGVTAMLRTAKFADFLGNDHLVGIYDTRLMAAGRQVPPTFHSKIWLGCYEGTWKATTIHNTTNEARWPMLLTRLDETRWSPEES